MDIPLASTFSMGLLAWWAWRESEKRIYLLAFYFLMALGTLAKGPVAPLLAGIVIVVFSMIAREARLIVRTLWVPAVLLFIAVALPWYIAVQLQNPQFFREFILQHNLARFSSNLYHHPEPFWYYIPVTLLALVPWIVVVILALVESVRVWWAERESTAQDIELQFRMFAACWLLVPVIFFSISQSKLPGYILPAVPAAALLLAEYLRRHREQGAPFAKWVAVLHAVVATAPIVPAVVIGYLVMQHQLPHGTPMYFALILALVVCIGVAITLSGRMQLRMLRFVTLIPVLLGVTAVLKFGTAAIDQKLSARPLALELASMETKKLPIAVEGVQRELEYGLAFYRNQPVHRYEAGDVPSGEHLLVAPTTWMDNVAKATAGRRVSLLGHYAPQAVDYYWVAAATNKP
jgi:4-amino-4-deoxy-L-arabinose transferase-like glycosyltransferase